MSFKLEIDNSKETLYDVLGVSEKRKEQLKVIIIESWKKEDLVTDAMRRIAQECNTINELVLAMVGLGQLMNELRKQ